MTTGQVLIGDALFGTPITAITTYSVANGGWESFTRFPRTVADVNGDGRADIVGFGHAATYVSLGQANGTFSDPITAIATYSVANGGWVNFNRFPRVVADVNGDARADIIGFGQAETYVSLGRANGTFAPPLVAISNYTVSNGAWITFNLYPRRVADVNGDGRADIIGFGQTATFVSLGQANGTFGPLITATSNYRRDDFPWSTFNEYPRQVADVNGDGRADIIGFGHAETYVSLGQANGTFGGIIQASIDYSLVNGGTIGSKGWSSFERVPRVVADVNGDGRADIIGFGEKATYVSLSRSDGTFASPLVATPSYSIANGGWISFDRFPRAVADVNGDGRADIIGFGQAGTYVSLAKTNFNDSLVGGDGNDTIDGLTDNDTINGRNGDDVLIGSSGNDRFVFDTNTAFNSQIGVDRIKDFFPSQDKIVLDKTTFKSLNTVSFASVSTLGQGLTGNALIFYLKPTGNLYYNQNGAATGLGSGGLFATLDNFPALAASDFVLVS